MAREVADDRKMINLLLLLETFKYLKQDTRVLKNIIPDGLTICIKIMFTVFGL